MEYDYYLVYQKENKYNECILKGMCSQDPSLVFLHEVVISYLQELSFYLIKLKELGITNDIIKENFLNAASGIIVNIEYTEEQFFTTIMILYNDILQAKELYISVGKRNDLEIKLFKPATKDPKIFNFSEAINQGQKLFNIKYKKFTPDQMRIYELFLNIAKSLCMNLIELKEFCLDDEKTYDALLAMLSIGNKDVVFLKKMQGILKEFVELDHFLLETLDEIKKERYGEIEPVEISTSIRPNKTILVSGSNLRELELLLEATKDKNIDIYTHGEMLSAHSYPKLKAYTNLVGHFGTTLENYLLDFSNFPGSIFLTRHSFLNVANLYQSSLYTKDVIAPQGVVTIMNNDFEPLIKSALRAEGFTESIKKAPINLNLSEKAILNKIAEVTEKIEEGKIKHFFVIGASNRTKEQEEYFKTFLNLLGDDCFVLSFSYYNNADNVLHFLSDHKFPLIYRSFKVLTRKMSMEQLNPIVLFTRCEPHTFSNVFHMKNIGIKKVYLADCPPMFVNPALVNALRRLFDLKNYTNPEDDLNDMLKN